MQIYYNRLLSSMNWFAELEKIKKSNKILKQSKK